MKVGDLVRPAKPREQLSQYRMNITGVVTEVSADDVDGVKQIFVRWTGDSDWSLEYSDQVEALNEIKPSDLVYYQAAGFNCTHGTDYDSPATVISLSHAPNNGKSDDVVKVFHHRKGEVMEVWRAQVGLLEGKSDGCW